MYNSPDWDPLKTLHDLTINLEEQSHLTLTITQQLNRLAQQLGAQNTAITQMAEYYNQLNRRMVVLEQQLKQ